jgi:hypothetical protein
MVLLAAVLSLAASKPATAAEGRAPAPSEAAIDRLATDWQWLRLLHISQPGQPSEIRSGDFFLAANGREDAAAELRATLAAYAAPWPEDQDSHPRCRFPARYHWLSRKIDLPGYVRREPRCRRFEQWARLDQLRSISVLLISGYFGNPASTFGHALIKLNTEQGLATDGLLDLSINYGALVPEHESAPVYVLRGLFGGYEAAFSDKLHYANDLVYARTEFRDVWDYELALDDDARELLVMHLWEVVGRKFAYYFLTENCAYRIAELIELATGSRLLERSSVWYIPVEMFHRLDDVPRRGGHPLVQSVRFVPSAERLLRQRLASLNPAEASVAQASIASDANDLDHQLQALPGERQPVVLDAMLAYYEYRLVADPSLSESTRGAKDRVLRQRLSLSSSDESTSHPVMQLPSLASASAPMVGALSAGHERHGESFVRLRWAPVSYDFTTFNGLETGELTVMDWVVDVDDRGAARLEQLDLARVRKLNVSPTRIPGESRMSWQARVGARRELRDGTAHTDGFAAFGVGRAASWGQSTLCYAMLDGLVQSAPSFLAIEPNIGLMSQRGRWKGALQIAARYDISQRRWRERGEVGLSHRLTQHRALRLELKRNERTRVALGFTQHW